MGAEPHGKGVGGWAAPRGTPLLGGDGCGGANPTCPHCWVAGGGGLGFSGVCTVGCHCTIGRSWALGGAVGGAGGLCTGVGGGVHAWRGDGARHRGPPRNA